MSDAGNISQAILPYYPDDSQKARYLAYRVSGFTMREACELVPCSTRVIYKWREQDEQFRKIDGEGLTDLRKQLSGEYLNIEFTRNFRLVMQKDFDILSKSIRGVELTTQENQYLLRLRSHYTPQHLLLIKQILGEIDGDESFDFTKLTLTIRREREELTVERGQ